MFEFMDLFFISEGVFINLNKCFIFNFLVKLFFVFFCFFNCFMIFVFVNIIINMKVMILYVVI